MTEVCMFENLFDHHISRPFAMFYGHEQFNPEWDNIPWRMREHDPYADAHFNQNAFHSRRQYHQNQDPPNYKAWPGGSQHYRNLEQNYYSQSYDSYDKYDYEHPNYSKTPSSVRDQFYETGNQQNGYRWNNKTRPYKRPVHRSRYKPPETRRLLSASNSNRRPSNLVPVPNTQKKASTSPNTDTQEKPSTNSNTDAPEEPSMSSNTDKRRNSDSSEEFIVIDDLDDELEESKTSNDQDDVLVLSSDSELDENVNPNECFNSVLVLSGSFRNVNFGRTLPTSRIEEVVYKCLYENLKELDVFKRVPEWTKRQLVLLPTMFHPHLERMFLCSFTRIRDGKLEEIVSIYRKHRSGSALSRKEENSLSDSIYSCFRKCYALNPLPAIQFHDRAESNSLKSSQLSLTSAAVISFVKNANNETLIRALLNVSQTANAVQPVSESEAISNADQKQVQLSDSTVTYSEEPQPSVPLNAVLTFVQDSRNDSLIKTLQYINDGEIAKPVGNMSETIATPEMENAKLIFQQSSNDVVGRIMNGMCIPKTHNTNNNNTTAYTSGYVTEAKELPECVDTSTTYMPWRRLKNDKMPHAKSHEKDVLAFRALIARRSELNENTSPNKEAVLQRVFSRGQRKEQPQLTEGVQHINNVQSTIRKIRNSIDLSPAPVAPKHTNKRPNPEGVNPSLSFPLPARINGSYNNIYDRHSNKMPSKKARPVGAESTFTNSASFQTKSNPVNINEPVAGVMSGAWKDPSTFEKRQQGVSERRNNYLPDIRKSAMWRQNFENISARVEDQSNVKNKHQVDFKRTPNQLPESKNPVPRRHSAEDKSSGVSKRTTDQYPDNRKHISGSQSTKDRISTELGDDPFPVSRKQLFASKRATDLRPDSRKLAPPRPSAQNSAEGGEDPSNVSRKQPFASKRSTDLMPDSRKFAPLRQSIQDQFSAKGCQVPSATSVRHQILSKRTADQLPSGRKPAPSNQSIIDQVSNTPGEVPSAVRKKPQIVSESTINRLSQNMKAAPVNQTVYNQNTEAAYEDPTGGRKKRKIVSEETTKVLSHSVRSVPELDRISGAACSMQSKNKRKNDTESDESFVNWNNSENVFSHKIKKLSGMWCEKRLLKNEYANDLIVSFPKRKPSVTKSLGSGAISDANTSRPVVVSLSSVDSSIARKNKKPNVSDSGTGSAEIGSTSSASEDFLRNTPPTSSLTSVVTTVNVPRSNEERNVIDNVTGSVEMSSACLITNQSSKDVLSNKPETSSLTTVVNTQVTSVCTKPLVYSSIKSNFVNTTNTVNFITPLTSSSTTNSMVDTTEIPSTAKTLAFSSRQNLSKEVSSLCDSQNVFCDNDANLSPPLEVPPSLSAVTNTNGHSTEILVTTNCRNNEQLPIVIESHIQNSVLRSENIQSPVVSEDKSDSEFCPLIIDVCTLSSVSEELNSLSCNTPNDNNNQATIVNTNLQSNTNTSTFEIDNLQRHLESYYLRKSEWGSDAFSREVYEDSVITKYIKYAIGLVKNFKSQISLHKSKSQTTELMKCIYVLSTIIKFWQDVDFYKKDLVSYLMDIVKLVKRLIYKQNQILMQVAVENQLNGSGSSLPISQSNSNMQSAGNYVTNESRLSSDTTVKDCNLQSNLQSNFSPANETTPKVISGNDHAGSSLNVQPKTTYEICEKTADAEVGEKCLTPTVKSLLTRARIKQVPCKSYESSEQLAGNQSVAVCDQKASTPNKKQLVSQIVERWNSLKLSSQSNPELQSTANDHMTQRLVAVPFQEPPAQVSSAGSLRSNSSEPVLSYPLEEPTPLQQAWSTEQPNSQSSLSATTFQKSEPVSRSDQTSNQSNHNGSSPLVALHMQANHQSDQLKEELSMRSDCQVNSPIGMPEMAKNVTSAVHANTLPNYHTSSPFVTTQTVSNCRSEQVKGELTRRSDCQVNSRVNSPKTHFSSEGNGKELPNQMPQNPPSRAHENSEQQQQLAPTTSKEPETLIVNNLLKEEQSDKPSCQFTSRETGPVEMPRSLQNCVTQSAFGLQSLPVQNSDRNHYSPPVQTSRESLPVETPISLPNCITQPVLGHPSHPVQNHYSPPVRTSPPVRFSPPLQNQAFVHQSSTAQQPPFAWGALPNPTQNPSLGQNSAPVPSSSLAQQSPQSSIPGRLNHPTWIPPVTHEPTQQSYSSAYGHQSNPVHNSAPAQQTSRMYDWQKHQHMNKLQAMQRHSTVHHLPTAPQQPPPYAASLQRGLDQSGPQHQALLHSAMQNPQVQGQRIDNRLPVEAQYQRPNHLRNQLPTNPLPTAYQNTSLASSQGGQSAARAPATNNHSIPRNQDNQSAERLAILQASKRLLQLVSRNPSANSSFTPQQQQQQLGTNCQPPSYRPHEAQVKLPWHQPQLGQRPAEAPVAPSAPTTLQTPPHLLCHNGCGQVAHLFCKGCCKALYCRNTQCQSNHWTQIHQYECQRLDSAMQRPSQV